MENVRYAPVVEELINLIAANGWQNKFEEALRSVQRYHVETMENIETLDDYFDWLDKFRERYI